MQTERLQSCTKMLRFFCCCCFSSDDDHSNERQPLLHPRTSEVNGAESARQTRRAHSDVQTVKQHGKLVMRRVCVPELDQRFSDMAETFNEQHKHYKAMIRHIRNLQRSYNCRRDESLSFAECVGKIREEQKARYRVSLVIKGYDFSLSAAPVGSGGKSEEKALPRRLQSAQDEVKRISGSAKAAISKGTTLQELFGWLLRCQVQMAEQVKGAAETYQERGRLSENLEENMKEVRRAKELSQEYKQQVGGVLTEAAEIAGAPL